LGEDPGDDEERNYGKMAYPWITKMLKKAAGHQKTGDRNELALEKLSVVELRPLLPLRDFRARDCKFGCWDIPTARSITFPVVNLNLENVEIKSTILG